MYQAVGLEASVAEKNQAYEEALARIAALIAQESDWVAAMATVVCELHHSFTYYNWTGFYRVVEPELLKVGPYQGTHGCLQIPFAKGVCGAAARLQTTQLVTDVNQFEGHIACSTTTISEIVVPILNKNGETLAVLDVDSDAPAAFDRLDQKYLEQLADMLQQRFG